KYATHVRTAASHTCQHHRPWICRRAGKSKGDGAGKYAKQQSGHGSPPFDDEFVNKQRGCDEVRSSAPCDAMLAALYGRDASLLRPDLVFDEDLVAALADFWQRRDHQEYNGGD